MTYVDINEEEFLAELVEATKEHRAGVAQDALTAATGFANDIADRGTLGASLEISGEDESILGTTDPAGHIKEWGSIDTPPHAVLRRAAEAVGAEVEDEGPA